MAVAYVAERGEERGEKEREGSAPSVCHPIRFFFAS
jgi:hypothetical protein